MNDAQHTRTIAMWSGPRNVSTAVMYAFAQRPDTQAVDEPLYGSYLATTGAEHPGREVVLEAMEHDATAVIEALPTGPKPVTFLKMMAHHMTGLDRSVLGRFQNFLLTRDPREVLPTLSVQVPQPELKDTGYAEQLDIIRFEQQAGRQPVVIEARELLQHPESVLKTCCERLDLGFDEAMLSWPTGPKPYDGVWAPFWYHNVHRSTGFAPYRPKTEPFPSALKPLLDQCLPIYEEISAYAIHA